MSRRKFHRLKVAEFKFDVPLRYVNPKPRILGKGAYGYVIAAHDKLRGNRAVAIKKIPKVFDDAVDAKRILREIKVLRVLEHPNIIKILDMPLGTSEEGKWRDLYIITDCMETDLHRIITSGQVLTLDHARYFVYQVLRALKYMHSAKIVHRDLKPANILVNADCSLKICDLGLARSLASSSAEDRSDLTNYVVTRWYRAPEVMLGSDYDQAIDLWSLGCIFGEIMERQVIFQGASHWAQIQKICTRVGKPTAAMLQKMNVSATVQRYVLSLPEPGPNHKPLGTGAAWSDRSAVGFLERVLSFEPTERLTAQGALQHPFMAPLHNPAKEPEADFVCSMDFEGKQLRVENIRRLMYMEAVDIESNILQQEAARTDVVSSADASQAGGDRRRSGAIASAGHDHGNAKANGRGNGNSTVTSTSAASSSSTNAVGAGSDPRNVIRGKIRSTSGEEAGAGSSPGTAPPVTVTAPLQLGLGSSVPKHKSTHSKNPFSKKRASQPQPQPQPQPATQQAQRLATGQPLPQPPAARHQQPQATEGGSREDTLQELLDVAVQKEILRPSNCKVILENVHSGKNSREHYVSMLQKKLGRSTTSSRATPPTAPPAGPSTTPSLRATDVTASSDAPPAQPPSLSSASSSSMSTDRWSPPLPQNAPTLAHEITEEQRHDRPPMRTAHAGLPNAFRSAPLPQTQVTRVVQPLAVVSEASPIQSHPSKHRPETSSKSQPQQHSQAQAQPPPQQRSTQRPTAVATGKATLPTSPLRYPAKRGVATTQALQEPVSPLKVPAPPGGGTGVMGGSRYQIGAEVQARFRGKPRWYNATVSAKNSDGTYQVKYTDGFSENLVAEPNIRSRNSHEKGGQSAAQVPNSTTQRAGPTVDFTLIEVFRQRRHQISKALHAEDETDGGSLEGSVFRGALASVVPELTATMIEDIMRQWSVQGFVSYGTFLRRYQRLAAVSKFKIGVNTVIAANRMHNAIATR